MSDPPAAPAPRGLPEVSRAIGALVASTTALSAIMFYFGWSRAYYFYDYFGVESSLLGLTTRDYLQLSVDGLFVPLAWAGGAALVVLWAVPPLARVLPAVTRRHPRWGAAAHALPVLGGLLLLNGLSAIFRPTPLNSPLALAPACTAAGAGLLIYSLRRYRPHTGVAEWAVVVVFAGLSLFWAANDYSAAVGTSRAASLAANLPYHPQVTIYSEKSLGLARPGIRELRCADAKAAYGFRYDGVKLIQQSGDQYLLLPADWNRVDGVAVLLPRSSSIRLEFAPADTAAVLPEKC